MKRTLKKIIRQFIMEFWTIYLRILDNLISVFSVLKKSLKCRAGCSCRIKQERIIHIPITIS